MLSSADSCFITGRLTGFTLAGGVLQAEGTAQNVEAGHAEIVQAVRKAKGARKKRKLCFIITLILFLVLAGVLSFVIVKVTRSKNSEN